MLKGIVSGSPVDITRIAMKGKNLFDKNATDTTNGYVINRYLTSDGSTASSSLYCISEYIPIVPSSTYTLYIGIAPKNPSICFYDSNKTYIEGTAYNNNDTVTVTAPDNAKYCRISYTASGIDVVMLNLGSQSLPYEPYGMQSGWEVRDQQGRIIWGADKTLTGTDSIIYKGYGLDIKEYDIDGNMVQAAEKEYSITGTSPLDFQSNGSNATISISGNETQASNQAYTTSGTSPLSFNADGTNLTALSMDGNMNQASSQPYTVSGTSPISFMNNGTAIDYTVSGNMNQTGTPTPSSPITPEETGDRTANLASGTSNIDTIVNGVRVKSDSYGTFTVSGEASSSGGRGVPISGTILLKAGTYSISTGSTITASLCISNAANNAFIVSATSESTFTLYSDTNIKFGLNFVSGQNYDESFTIMLNTGSTAQPYEPFGYKIPITNGSTTYNIYLSEPLRKIGDYSDIVNSDGSVSRGIYKQVLTGNEPSWDIGVISSTGNGRARLTPDYTAVSTADGRITVISSHYLGAFSDNNLRIRAIQGTGVIQIVDADHATDLTTWTNYLKAQYAAGTPVEIWYVLSTTQTDTATVPTITPTSGNNTLSVDTTLAPSNITITSNSSVFPENPITPIECGVKTENLYDYKTAYSAYLNAEDDVAAGSLGAVHNSLADFVGKTVTISVYCKTVTATRTFIPAVIGGVEVHSNSIYQNNTGYMTLTVTPESEDDYWIISYGNLGTGNNIYSDFMLNSGSAPLPYEPYGKYKIPISNAGTTYNVYLTEPLRKIGDYGDTVSSDGTTVRRIKKVVFTGQETWTEVYPGEPEAQGIVMYATSLSEIGTDRNDFICSHFFVGNYRGYLISGQGRINGTSPEAFNLNYNNGSGGLQNFKAWLASEYAAGTPVTVWYALATPDTTETTTIPTISTVNGSNTLTTGTPITPSNITISTSSSVYPKNPIYPEECGDKTANLFDDMATINIPSLGIRYGMEMPIGTYSIRNDTDNIVYYFTNGGENRFVACDAHTTNTVNLVQEGSSASGFMMPYNSASLGGVTIISGSTPPNQYIPYGFQIPITNAGTTYNIFLTEPLRKIGDYADTVDSSGTVTRRIVKLVLTGEETFSSSYSGNNKFFYTNIATSGRETTVYSSHFVFANIGSTTTDVGIRLSSGTNLRIRPENVASMTSNDFTQWIADEYAAGHPVTVWYVLATPVSDTATFPTVTPASGSNTLSVNTTLAPSSITLTTTSGVWSKNPIEPEEFGDMTANLFDGVWEIGNISASGEMTDINYHVRSSNYTDVSGLSYISATFARTFTSVRICEYDDTKTFLQRSAYETSSVTHQLMQETKYIKLVINDGMAQFPDVTSPDYYTMLVSGQTALPYEPYGKYKIPITNSGQTYNIFLNEPLRKIRSYADTVESDGTVMRRIDKIVLTGEETWSSAVFSGHNGFLSYAPHAQQGVINCVCSHYKVAYENTDNTIYFIQTPANGRFIIFDDRFSYTTDFKTFLSSEYTAGHPVEIWYALSTPTTETITTPTIATTVGTNTLTVDTTLSPSQTTITGHIKPIHFGFKINKTNDNSDTAVTYTHDAVTMTPAAMNFTTGEFNYGSWENVWFVKDAYPVALNLDGTEAYKLNPDDYTKKEDGTDSDIQFVLLTEAPSDWSTQWKQYYTKDANDNYELNSQSSVPTFAQNTYYKLTYNSSFTGNFMMAFPKVYFKRTEDATYNYVEISNKKLGDDWYAYAHINTSGQEVGFIYLPLFKGVIVDSKLRSIPGQIPQGGTTATDEVNAATALGSRWQIWDHSSIELINDLLTLMSKSIDSQGKFGQGRSSGYDSTDTVTYGKIQTGTLIKKGKFHGFSSSYKEVKVFGIEGFWANRLDRLQGMLLVDNVWKIKMTPPYNFTGTDFVTLSSASVPSGNGYLSKVQTSQYGSIPASIEGGGSSKFYKDYFYKTATDTRVALRGGYCSNGGAAGFRCVYVNVAASVSSEVFGASPLYK